MWHGPLVKKRKKLARTLLYSGGLALVGVIALVAAYSKIPLDFEDAWMLPVETYEQMPEVAMFQEYLRVDTSPSGSEVDGAEFLAAKLAEVGVEARIERIGTRNANLWAIVEGEDPRALVLHNHIDVDAITHPDAWQYGPFEARIKVPWLFGRGAFDMKSIAIAQLTAIRDLAKSGVKPRRSVIFLATGDEETGSWLGLRWFLRQHPDLVARFETVLTEGGVVETIDRESVKYWGLEFAQKRYFWLTACHPKKERLEAMIEDIESLDAGAFQRFLTPQVAAMLEIYGPTRENPRFQTVTDLDAYAQDARFSQLPDYLQLMVRGDVVARDVEADPRGTGFELRIFLALAPADSLERAMEEMLPAWITHGVAISVDSNEPRAGESPLDHPDARAIQRFMALDTPKGVHGPLLIPFAMTDARFFRAEGIATYGYSPFLIFSTDTQQMKGPNERIALPGFIDGVRRYSEMVHALVAGTAKE